ncbi:hypothetical protein HYQ44_014896 [Verticillium longisporum]|nr:hypothetical protein HYQ44_014896 [Verticillium longisporum]
MDGNELVELWLQRVNDRPRNTTAILGKRHDRHRTQRRTVRHREHLAGGDACDTIGQSQKHTWADDNPLPPTRDHVDTANGSLEDDSPRMPAFEKRARHKTRHDKYDLHGSPQKTVSKSKAEKIKRPSRRRETNNRILLASREVMDNFAPEAVHNSRVTLQPANTPGLFHNGRHATQQNLGHGSMEIASSHEHRLAKKCVPSRSRDRKHKKRGRELDEASDIFRRPMLQGDRQKVQDMVRYEDKGVMARELSLDREARMDHSVAPEEMHEEAFNGEVSRDEIAKQIYLKSPAPKSPLPVSPASPQPQGTISLEETRERHSQRAGDDQITRPLTAPVESTPGDRVAHLPKECPAVPVTKSPADAQFQSQLDTGRTKTIRTRDIVMKNGSVP